MKIAFDISQVVYEGTGVANYTRNLIRHLSQRENITLLLFGYSYGFYYKLEDFYQEVKSENPGIEKKFFKIPQNLANFFWNRLHLIPVEKFIGPVDIVHTSDWIEPPAKAKKVTTIHDLIIYKYQD